jgi:hypothetical protein
MRRRDFFLSSLSSVFFAGSLFSGDDPEPSASSSPRHRSDVEADVVVYGGTSGGVMAAYTAKQYGKSVVLVTPGEHVGGLTTGGLGMTDVGSKDAIHGLAREFYRRVGEHYDQEAAWRFSPSVAEQVMEAYLDEAGVEVLTSRRVVAVEKDGPELEAITCEYAGPGQGGPPIRVAGRYFLDTSYEGDLLARAGVSYTVGRESNRKYDEQYNGVQFEGNPQAAPGASNHQFPGYENLDDRVDVTYDSNRKGGAGAGATTEAVDPYVEPGDPSSGLLPEVTKKGVAPNGTGDRKVQAYCFRLCCTQDETNQIDFPKPPGYEPARYELLRRDMEADPPENLNDIFKIDRMPEEKSDWNNRGAFSEDYIGNNWDYPEASYRRREQIWAEHRRYQQGLCYFVANDDRVPSHIQEEMRTWGLARDEFLDTNHWSHALYVREGRRMVSDFVMTEQNVIGDQKVADGVAEGAYTLDSHNVQRVAVEGPDGPMVKNEGNVQVGVDDPYPISYRALVPRRSEATNLVVPVALSSSHIAFGSIRMEPVFMMLGQAGGLAAAMAHDRHATVQDLDGQTLQQELKENPLAGRSVPEDAADVVPYSFQ